MKVLLISPLPKIDVPCGDVTYTETLLAYPPEGVEYETYAEALARGTLVEHGIRRSLKQAIKDRKHIFRESAFTIFLHSINFLKHKHWLFWEPFRFFSVKPGEYDLVHLHVFNAKFLKLPCPLLISGGAPTTYLYTDGRNYSKIRATILEKIEILISRLFGINSNSYYLPQADYVVAWTLLLKDWYVQHKMVKRERIALVPPYLEIKVTEPIVKYPTKVGFVAKDFEAKGGPTLLKAFEKVRKVRSDATLTIIGCPPQLTKEEAEKQGIIWQNYIPREELMSDVLPDFDLFAYPTKIDSCPVILLEVMANGIPIATSDYRVIPSVIADSGLISPVNDADKLAENILQLLQPDTNEKYSRAAYERFRSEFSADVVKAKLREAYNAAIKSSKVF